jgi:voltage-gated sodium channel
MRGVDDTENTSLPGLLGRLVAACQVIAASSGFQAVIITVIVVNALVLGLETYDSLDNEIGGLLHTLNNVFLGVFTVEIAIRLIAYGRRPGDFFRNGWNVFDFVVVGAAYLPFVRESVTLLRMARLLRIARLLSVIPGLRIVVLGIARSLAPIGGMAALTFFVLYLYGMVGWLLYDEHDPERFGNIGRSLLTLFQVLTLEGWNDVLAKEMEYSSWSWVYFVSFVLVGTFVVLNVVIAIIVNSMDEVREMERRRAIAELAEEAAAGAHPQAELLQHVESLRAALDELERELAASGDSGRGSRRTAP